MIKILKKSEKGFFVTKIGADWEGETAPRGGGKKIQKERQKE